MRVALSQKIPVGIKFIIARGWSAIVATAASILLISYTRLPIWAIVTVVIIIIGVGLWMERQRHSKERIKELANDLARQQSYFLETFLPLSDSEARYSLFHMIRLLPALVTDNASIKLMIYDKIKTHLPSAQNFRPTWDRQCPPLAKWNRGWSMRQELCWGNQYLQSIRNYLAKPKTSRSDICQLQLIFPREVDETVVVFSVLRSLAVDVEQAPHEIRSPSFCTWNLVDSWPHVLVSVANLGMREQCIELKSVGRDYRVSDPYLIHSPLAGMRISVNKRTDIH